MGRDMRVIKIASRKSDLARIQSQTVGQKLQEKWKEKKTELQIEFQFRESLGDVNLDNPLWKMPEKGVFTEDFYKDLCEEKTDAVVHSWKDLPIVEKDETFIVATLPREDARDVILFKKTHLKKFPLFSENLKNESLQAPSNSSEAHHLKLRLFSSSPRREYNLTPFLKDALPFSFQALEFQSVRGNIQTRVRKLLENDSIDGLVVAKAALDRLLSTTTEEYKDTRVFLSHALNQCELLIAPLSVNPTAAAQGALAIEIKRSRKDLIEYFSAINCEKTLKACNEERNILKKHGGGCHQKIGVSLQPKDYGNILSLRGLTERGEVLEHYELLKEIDLNSFKNLKLFPGFKEENFKRKILEISDENLFESLQWLGNKGIIFISRENALSSELYQRIIAWADKNHASFRFVTAGLKTLKKCVKRGIFIHETLDGLGEESLFNSEKVLKLTHEESTEHLTVEMKALTPFPLKSLSTYQLQIEPTFNRDEILNADLFYWMSYTQFMAVYAITPEILSKKHVVGPGNTARYLKEKFKEKIDLHIEIGVDSLKNKRKE